MAKERLIFSDVEHVRCPNCNYRIAVESEFARFVREAKERASKKKPSRRSDRGRKE
jgi:DNA-directed RNA polymerase subunit RPC12/RpoP